MLQSDLLKPLSSRGKGCPGGNQQAQEKVRAPDNIGRPKEAVSKAIR